MPPVNRDGCLNRKKSDRPKGEMKLIEIWRLIYSYTPRNERGQDLAEYAMLIGFIALVVIGAAMLLGNGLSLLLDAIASEVGP